MAAKFNPADWSSEETNILPPEANIAFQQQLKGMSSKPMPGAAPTATQQQQASSFNPEDWAGSSQGADTIQTSPAHMGFTPDSAVNESPFSTSDRFKMAVGEVGGNETGKVKYARDLGYEVKRNKDGDLVAKKDSGPWQYFDSKDPWSLSAKGLKEAAGDIAEAIPDVGFGALQGIATTAATALAGAGILAAPATGGTSAVAGIASGVALNAVTAGVLAKARTTWGKSLGTYAVDDPASEFQDVMLESVIGGIAGGAGKALEAGAKPTVAWFTKQLGSLGEKAAVSGDVAKRVMADGIKYGIGVSDEAAATAVERAPQVAQIIKDAGSWASASSIERTAKQTGISEVKTMAAQMPDVRTAVYKAGVKDIGAAVGEEWAPASKQALVQFMSSEGGVGDAIHILAPYKNPKTGETQLIKTLAQDVTDWSKVRIVAKSMANEADAKEIANNPILRQLIGSEEVSSHIEKSANNIAKTLGAYDPALKGEKAVADWLDTSKVLKRSLKIADSTKAAAPGISQATQFFDGALGKALDQQLVAKAASPEAAQVIQKAVGTYRDNYSQMKRAFSFLEDAAQKGLKNDAAFEGLYNQLVKSGSANLTKKELFNNVLDYAKRFTPDVATKLEASLLNIHDHAAAASFAPFISKNMQRIAAPFVLGGIGGAVASGGDMNTTAVSAIGAGALLTSPRLAIKAMAQVSKFGYPASEATMQALQSVMSAPGALNNLRLYSGLTKSLSAQAVQNPNVTAPIMKQIMDTLLVAPHHQEQTRQQLMQQATSQPTATQQGVNFSNPSKSQQGQGQK